LESLAAAMLYPAITAGVAIGLYWVEPGVFRGLATLLSATGGPALVPVAIATALGGVIAFGLVAGVSRWEEHASQQMRLGLKQQIATRLARLETAYGRIAVGSRSAIRADAPTTRAPAPRIRATRSSASDNLFVAWPVFAKLLSVQRAVAHGYGRCFTVLALRPSGDDRNLDREARGNMMRQLLDRTTRRCDVASLSPSCNGFVLLPEISQEEGRAIAERLADRFEGMLGQRYRLEIRQFTYIGTQRRDTVKLAGYAAAA
jgi:hypothetical protein